MKTLVIFLLLLPYSGFASILFVITGNGLKQPSYILGTTHLICEKDYLWTQQMQQYLEASERVCLEMDITAPITSKQAIYSPLKERLNPEQYKQLSVFLKTRLGLQISYMDRTGMAMIQSLIMSKIVDCAFPMSYEGDIMQRCVALNKKIVGLETYSEQQEYINSIPEKEMIRGIMNMTSHYNTVRVQYNYLLSLFRKQDIAGIDKITRTDIYYHQMVENRNRKWLPKMENMMKQHSVFFAVGVGHVTGIIKLLKQKGYKYE